MEMGCGEGSSYPEIFLISALKMVSFGAVRVVFYVIIAVITHTHTTVLRLCGICPGKPG